MELSISIVVQFKLKAKPLINGYINKINIHFEAGLTHLYLIVYQSQKRH